MSFGDPIRVRILNYSAAQNQYVGSVRALHPDGDPWSGERKLKAGDDHTATVVRRVEHADRCDGRGGYLLELWPGAYVMLCCDEAAAWMPGQRLPVTVAEVNHERRRVAIRRASPDPSWLTLTVVGLARAIDSEQAFDRLPVLADALQEAGCDDDDVLAHCRRDGQHSPGCWVVDLLLGKNPDRACEVAYLVLVRQPGTRYLRIGDTFPLIAARTLIGRRADTYDPHATRPDWVTLEEGFIGLENPAAARRHVAVCRTATGYAIQHLVRSGLTVNGRECLGGEVIPLVDGDMIRVCDYYFTFRGDSPVPAGGLAPA